MTFEFAQTVKSLQKRSFDPNETMQWLTANRMTFWSWGVSKRVNFDNKALALKVSARRWKGFVVITLGWDDIYIVSYMTQTGRIHKTFEGVYCDDLVEVIDNEIENVPEYHQ